jgi:hypothetical protein
MKEGDFMPVINPLPDGYVMPVNEKTKPLYALIAKLAIKYLGK